MISQTLEQKLTQKLSPLQIQTIKLLELSIQDLEQRVRAEIEENPALDDTTTSEEGSKEVSLDSLDENDPTPAYKLKVNNWGKDPRPEYNTFAVRESFLQGLMDQLGFKNLSEQEYRIAAFLIGSLNENGYLERDIPALTDDLAFRFGVETTEEEVEHMLRTVQTLDPAGIGARNLRECLLIQLQRAPKSDVGDLALRIVRDEFAEFSAMHFPALKAKLGVSDDELKAAVKRISRLNPSPGGQVEDAFIEQSQQIVPDFKLIENEDGTLSFEMARGSIPELRISHQFEQMLRDAQGRSEREQKETITFVKSKIDSAKWFIEAIKQRRNTLQKTMQSILNYQMDFFLTGDEKRMRPLILETIADDTGFDISTISRVVNEKYIETPFGIFQLKYFFSEKLVNSKGEEVSTREVKSALQDIIDAEDKSKPLTDEQLVEELGRKGYEIARRTVAKYRQQLGIPIGRLRVRI
ncbi:MAG: RNA polymerase factor sigma-54 [Bacteroidales bacterium]|nr:RNA polymerase factor sigma-54 [Candidatus Cryptobacteroides aphodequi]